ncbi:MAG: hypothetical protein J7L47_02720 [Candidatus Odinarchaeota archaeon]|nr:hypothetical protein [Candidatus Odinarchaeota archaeon]
MNLILPFAAISETLLNYTGVILILGGISLASFFFEALSRHIPIFGKILTPIIKLISIFGFFIGIVCIVVAYYGFMSETLGNFTLGILALLGIALTIAPIVTKVPIAALIAIASGGALAMLVIAGVPPGVWSFLVTINPALNKTNIAIVAFLIGAVIVYSLTKMISDLLEFLGRILTSKPVAFILGLLAIAEGILNIMSMTLWTYIAPLISSA